MFHPNLPSLRTLLSGISLPKTDEEGGEVIIAVAAAPTAADPSPLWTSRLASLNKMQGDGKIVVIISGMFLVKGCYI
jgi:proline racemase